MSNITVNDVNVIINNGELSESGKQYILSQCIHDIYKVSKTLFTKPEIDLQINLTVDLIKQIVDLNTTVFVPILNGGLWFFSKLQESLNIHNICYVKCSTYGNSIISNGDTNVEFINIPQIKPKTIIIIDDVIETKNTFYNVKRECLREFGDNCSKSFGIMLCNKQEDTITEINTNIKHELGNSEYTALFNIDKQCWIYGCGLDLFGKGRTHYLIKDSTLGRIDK